MSKVTLTNITSGYGTATKLNDNFDSIEEAFDNTLSRDGSTPNSMEAAIDMNGNPILNLGAPVDSNSAVRRADVEGLVDIQGIGAPSQTGNAGKPLVTDGTTASWDALSLSGVGLTGNLPVSRLNSGTGATNRTFWGGDGTWRERPGTVVEWPFVPLADGSTITCNCTLSNNFITAALGGNRTLVLSSPVDGQSIEIWFLQDSVGSRTITWPGNVLFETGTDVGLSGVPNQIDRYKLTYSSSQDKWFAQSQLGGPQANLAISIGGNELDVYLYDRAGRPSAASIINATISQGSVLQALTTGSYALDTSGFPSGTIINLTNNGYCIGRGGDGGTGATHHTSNSSSVQVGYRGTSGRTGGTAILGPGSGRVLNITNLNGFIWGGGGGGGGGGAGSNNFGEGAGGGGGGGAGGGLGGKGFALSDSATIEGSSGSSGVNGTFGAGATGQLINAGSGGAGGAGGAHGTAGTAGTAASIPSQAAGGAGAAGKAVDINGATVTIVNGNGFPNIKGLIS